MSLSLTLVRHGESEANVAHMLSGWMDVPLTERGRHELEDLRLSVDYPKAEILFSSPLQRCCDTAAILFPDMLPIVSDRFKEIDFRSLEGTILHSKEEIRSYFVDWVADRPRKDEETFTPVARRMGVTLETTARDCLEKGIRSATVVMHSGIMRVGLITLFGLPREDFNRMSVANGRGVVITFDDDARPVEWRWL